MPNHPSQPAPVEIPEPANNQNSQKHHSRLRDVYFVFRLARISGLADSTIFMNEYAKDLKSP